jgi:hypothetical protein
LRQRIQGRTEKQGNLFAEFNFVNPEFAAPRVSVNEQLLGGRVSVKVELRADKFAENLLLSKISG